MVITINKFGNKEEVTEINGYSGIIFYHKSIILFYKKRFNIFSRIWYSIDALFERDNNKIICGITVSYGDEFNVFKHELYGPIIGITTSYGAEFDAVKH